MEVNLIADVRAKRITRISAKGTPDGSKPTRRPSTKPAGNKEGSSTIEARGDLPEPLKELDGIVQSFLSEQSIRGGAVVIVKDGKEFWRGATVSRTRRRRSPPSRRPFFRSTGFRKF